jgi:transcriptional regulator with XRE-family HTH domain
MSETFGARLRQLRQEAGLTQEAVAQAANVPLPTLRNWERDRREPLASAVAALARALGVSADRLLGLEAPSPAATSAEPPAEIDSPPPEPPPAPKKPRGRPRKDASS